MDKTGNFIFKGISTRGRFSCFADWLVNLSFDIRSIKGINMHKLLFSLLSCVENPQKDTH